MKKLMYLFLFAALTLGSSYSMEAQVQPETEVIWTGDLLPPCFFPGLLWSGDGDHLPILWGQSTTISDVYQSVSAVTNHMTGPNQSINLSDGATASMEFCCDGFKLILHFQYNHIILGQGTPQELLVGAELKIDVTHTQIPCE